MVVALLALLQSGPSVPPDFSQAWDKTEQTIRQYYYARESKKVEMNALLSKYAPIASKATTKGEFRDDVDEMIAEFKDSHFEMLTDEDQGYYLMDGIAKGHKAADMPEIGAWFKETPQGYQVQMVTEGSPAAAAGLRKGDTMLAVDDQPFSPVQGFRHDVGKQARLRVARDGKELLMNAGVATEPALDMFLDGTRDSAHIIVDGGKKIGYVHLWTQANDDFKNLLSSLVYGKLAYTDAMILDLRDGFGGRPEGYGDPFFRPGVTIDWKFTNSTSHEMYGYDKPLAVLINSGSRSAKEVLSFIFKVSHRATLIGTTTAGNVLGTTPIRINDWAYLEVPIVDVYTNGVRLEGRGVVPDVQVPQEFDSAGNDLVTRKAVEFLLSKVR